MFSYKLTIRKFSIYKDNKIEEYSKEEFIAIDTNYLVTLLTNRQIKPKVINNLFSLIGQQVKDPCVYTEIVDNKFIKISANYELPDNN